METHANPHSFAELARQALLSRRAFVQAGTIGLTGLGMGDLEALRGEGQRPRARSVIYIFLSGGLAQHESFDPKPDGPTDVRGEFGVIPTATPGIEISEHLPLLARRSEKWALVRSLTHPWNEHSEGHLTMLTGRTPMPVGFDGSKPKPSDWPALASVARHFLSNNPSPSRTQEHAATLPPSAVLPHVLVHRTGRVIPGQFGGEMGERWDPWLVKAASDCRTAYGACPECFHHAKGPFNHTTQPVFQAPNLVLPEGLTRHRFDRRLGFLEFIEGQQRELERFAEVRSLDRHRQQALSLLSDRAVQRAFDVHGAEPRLLDRYGRNQFGWSLLMARRLVAAGVSLVQVNLGNNETWDTHQAAFPNLKNHLLPPLDRSLSALLDDLDANGLLEETLVVVAGEFGRTPKITTLPGAKLAGRDHWGAVQTVFFAGGGVRGGTVVGSSDARGAYPASDPWKPENMAATIYDVLGIPRTAVWYDPTNRPHLIYHGEPIDGLRA